MFIDPAPAGKEFWATDIESGKTITFPKGHSKEGQPLFKRRFIPASLFDNPYLAEEGDYEAMLLSLPEHQRKQLLEGNWDINEEQPFPNLTELPTLSNTLRFLNRGYVFVRVITVMAVTLGFFGLLWLLMTTYSIQRTICF